MSVQIKTPNITGGTDREKLVQIQSYLYQMARQLQWAFDTVEFGNQITVTTNANTGGKGKAPAAADPLKTFAGLKSLIIKSADIVDAYYDEINNRLKGVYVAQSDFGTYAQETDLEIKGNSESINQLYSNNQTIVTRVDGLTTDTESLSGRVDGLASDTGSLSGRVDGLNDETKNIAESVEELYVKILDVNAYIKTGLLWPYLCWMRSNGSITNRRAKSRSRWTEKPLPETKWRILSGINWRECLAPLRKPESAAEKRALRKSSS